MFFNEEKKWITYNHIKFKFYWVIAINIPSPILLWREEKKTHTHSKTLHIKPSTEYLESNVLIRIRWYTAVARWQYEFDCICYSVSMQTVKNVVISARSKIQAKEEEGKKQMNTRTKCPYWCRRCSFCRRRNNIKLLWFYSTFDD